MLRDVNLNEISDGKEYHADDLVKMGCNDCKDCHLCCTGMGSSIILDPLDIYNMQKATGENFQTLLIDKLELNVVEGIISPNIKMSKEDACAFLNSEGRCSIHDLRPGFCRLFPLGRLYIEEGFIYFHQIHECPYPNKTKVKIKNWLGIPDIKEYEKYILIWHNFLKEMKEFIDQCKDEEQISILNKLILITFFVDGYNLDVNFYEQFYERLGSLYKKLGIK